MSRFCLPKICYNQGAERQTEVTTAHVVLSGEGALSPKHTVNIAIGNNGKEIASTNYWETPFAQAGNCWLSTNAGCIRLLVPDDKSYMIPDMVKGAKHVVLSIKRTFTEDESGIVGEFMIENGGDEPWVMFFGMGCFDVMPKPGDKWEAAIWGRKNLKHHKFMQRPAFVRSVHHIPCLAPYDANAAAQAPMGKNGSTPTPDVTTAKLAIHEEIAKSFMDALIRRTPANEKLCANFCIFGSNEAYQLSDYAKAIPHDAYKEVVQTVIRMAPSHCMEVELTEFRMELFHQWKHHHRFLKGLATLDMFTATSRILRRKTIYATDPARDVCIDKCFHITPSSEVGFLRLSSVQVVAALKLIDAVEAAIYAPCPTTVAADAGFLVTVTAIGDQGEVMGWNGPSVADSDLLITLRYPSAKMAYQASNFEDLRDVLRKAQLESISRN